MGDSQSLDDLFRVAVSAIDAGDIAELDASALHHAVSSGSLEAVRVLVDAGANLRARDTAYRGTPRNWAEHSAGNPQYDEIAAYLRKCGG